MRLLVVGHSYVTAFAQAKYVAMKTLRRNLQLRLVVPPFVRHSFATHRREVAPGLRHEEVVAMGSFGGRSFMTRAIDPFALGTLMRRFAPTHIHVEEDPHSAVGGEAACLAALLCPTAALSFFIWDNLNRRPRFPAGVAKRGLTRFSLARARLVICGNEEGMSLLPAKGYFGAAAVIPQLGLDAADVTDRGTSPAGTVTIGYFGRLVEEKGLRDLLAALQTLLDCRWRLVVCGNGPLREEIWGPWRRLLGERLICRDPVSHTEVQSNLGKIDIFVLPSYTTAIWKEQFGLTLAQAMLAECACIGSSSGAIPEVLAGTGLIFPERTVPALASALRRLIEGQAERLRCGLQARAVALARYTNTTIARRQLEALDAVTV